MQAAEACLGAGCGDGALEERVADLEERLQQLEGYLGLDEDIDDDDSEWEQEDAETGE